MQTTKEGSDITMMTVSEAQRVQKFVQEEVVRNKEMSRSHKDKYPEIRELKDQRNPERAKDAAQLVESARTLRARRETVPDEVVGGTRKSTMREDPEPVTARTTAKRQKVSSTPVPSGEDVVVRVLGHKGDDEVYTVEFANDPKPRTLARENFVDEVNGVITDKIVRGTIRKRVTDLTRTANTMSTSFWLNVLMRNQEERVQGPLERLP